MPYSAIGNFVGRSTSYCRSICQKYKAEQIEGGNRTLINTRKQVKAKKQNE